MDKPMYISGQIIDEGIDGLRFIIDYSWICDTQSTALSCKDLISSQVYRLSPVRISKRRKNDN